MTLVGEVQPQATLTETLQRSRFHCDVGAGAHQEGFRWRGDAPLLRADFRARLPAGRLWIGRRPNRRIASGCPTFAGISTVSKRHQGSAQKVTPLARETVKHAKL